MNRTGHSVLLLSVRLITAVSLIILSRKSQQTRLTTLSARARIAVCVPSMSFNAVFQEALVLLSDLNDMTTSVESTPPARRTQKHPAGGRHLEKAPEPLQGHQVPREER